MIKDLAVFAKKTGVKYFMISYTDLFGVQRAKLVPTQAIADMQVEGAGFAGFATWLDLLLRIQICWQFQIQAALYNFLGSPKWLG